MGIFRFKVTDMTCGGCVGSVRRAISKLDGVDHVDVTLQPGSATVHADPNRVTTAQIQATLAKLGVDAQAMGAGA